jgi:hypothetical protein
MRARLYELATANFQRRDRFGTIGCCASAERAQLATAGGGTRPKAISRQRFPLPFPMLSFDRPRFVLPAVERAMKLRHGRAPRR